jgi:rubrerythrin
METKTASDILKTAILMERRGKAFYEKVAEQTQSMEVRNIFNIMAEEENSHIEFLSKQFSNYEKNKTFVKNDFHTADDQIAKMILNKDIKKQISAAGFEAAAISAAIDMENKAIEVYSSRAKESSDESEKELFNFLANWEKGHLKMLMDLNKELMEEIWYDNNFWPF